MRKSLQGFEKAGLSDAKRPSQVRRVMKAVLIRRDQMRYPVSTRPLPDRPTPAIRGPVYTFTLT